MYKKQLYIFYLSILPLMICSGIVYSVLALYISEELAASRTQIGFLFTTGAATGAAVAPFIGRLSDRVGRRPILLASMVGFMLAFVFYALVRNVTQVFAVQALEGASWMALGTAAMAYIADIAPPERRGWAMGMYEGTWSVGWIIGPTLGGVMADAIGFRPTFAIGASLIILGLALIWLYIKEPQKASS